MILSLIGVLVYSIECKKYARERGANDKPDLQEKTLFVTVAVCEFFLILNLIAIGDVFPTISSAQKASMTQGGAK